MSAPDGDDYTWTEPPLRADGGQPDSSRGLLPAHVEAMEQVVRLWPYPTVAAVGVLMEVLGFVRAAAGPVSGVTYQVSGEGGGGWDWREDFGPLDVDGCYECDQ